MPREVMLNRIDSAYPLFLLAGASDADLKALNLLRAKVAAMGETITQEEFTQAADEAGREAGVASDGATLN